MELTILMPCLNEEETIGQCVAIAKTYLEEHGIDGEVLVADNYSTDRSVEIAKAAGARVVPVKDRGYGAALIGGHRAALGKYIIFGDCDMSYDFSALDPYMEKLREGYDLVMGNRFKGGIMKGAMPASHQYFGVPFLSGVARILFPCKIGDFHCGLRGYRKSSIEALHLQTPGMEYASEMIVRCVQARLKIAEIPIVLHPDGRSGKPHLRSIPDGIRHLKYLLHARFGH